MKREIFCRLLSEATLIFTNDAVQVDVFCCIGQYSVKNLTDITGNGQRSVKKQLSYLSPFGIRKTITRDSFQGQEAVSEQWLKVWRNTWRTLIPIYLIITKCMMSVSKTLYWSCSRLLLPILPCSIDEETNEIRAHCWVFVCFFFTFSRCSIFFSSKGCLERRLKETNVVSRCARTFFLWKEFSFDFIIQQTS